MAKGRVPGLTREPELLETPRLLLEPLAVSHAVEMAKVLDHPDLHRYVGGEPLSVDELQSRYERQVRGGPADGSEYWFNWVLRERSSRAAVGYVQASVAVGSQITDVAWVVGHPDQRRGFAREAAESMVAWLRANGAAGFTAYINPENRPSEAVARTIGLAPTGELRAGERRWASS